MEFRQVVRQRRMVRSFSDEPVDPRVLDRLLGDALRAPSAGNSQGTDLIVLEGAAQTALFWDTTLPPEKRATFRWQGLLRAPVLVIPLTDAARYVERYGEPDKARTGLGEGTEAWPVPYWTVDTSFVAMSLLLGVVDAGLGALFFGIFRAEAELLEKLGVPPGHRPVGAIAIGHPDGADEPGRSVDRTRRPLSGVVHHGGWGGDRVL